MIRVTSRRALRRRLCECGAVIDAGDRYLEHVCSPWHDDIGNETWWRLAECVDCAERYGRGHLVSPRAEASR